MEQYVTQTTSVWSFPDRGNWATHKGDYRGNWSPHIPRNLILKYSKENETVLDCFLGSGTTLTECRLLNRNGIGLDINKVALSISKERINFKVPNNSIQTLYECDSRNMDVIQSESVDFICTHPPYADIIKYSDGDNRDLSLLEYHDFIHEMESVAKECFRVLKPNCFCSYMIGDIRKKGNVIPLGFLSMNAFINNGFTLKEIIIKVQHNCQSTKYWEDKAKKMNFYLLAHEYIFVFVKNKDNLLQLGV